MPYRVPSSVTASLPSRGAWIEIANCRPAASLWPVAPLAGSVDRNAGGSFGPAQTLSSLPSRGAWIEIKPQKGAEYYTWVAPLAGSVDRNVF